MNVFDWLSNMDAPVYQQFDVVEVKFKGGRKEYFRNVNQLELYTGDQVVVEVAAGHHVGVVSLQGELVRLQLIKKNIPNDEHLKTIYRKANDKDVERHEQSIARDLPTMYRTREIVRDMNLNMKLSDVEFQSDGTKATFYYSSDERVDFRELIKTLAGEFKVRVEMKQISLRQEASRLGGIGVCGRELCCSTWLTDYKNVTTSAARYQNLSLNPSKLSGQCGRLKCCLNYELETYMDALRDIPSVEGPLLTQKGAATLQKTDIFRKIMWFGYDTESNWYPVPVARVREILELNKKGIRPLSFEILEESLPETGKLLPTPATLNSDLERLDRKFEKERDRNRSKNKNKKSNDSEKKQEAKTQNQQKLQAVNQKVNENQQVGNQQNRQKQNKQQQPKQQQQPPKSTHTQPNNPPKAEQPNKTQSNQSNNPPKAEQPNKTQSNQSNNPPKAEQPNKTQSNQLNNPPKAEQSNNPKTENNNPNQGNRNDRRRKKR
ncbi:MAG: regulatory iron-sulfur-containing complex subunit RicT [Spirosomataceae bacterium]